MRRDCAPLDIVAISELASNESLVYLTQFDSTHGRFPGEVTLKNSSLHIGGVENQYQIELLAADKQSVPNWSDHDIDLVLDCTGEFGEYELAKQHTNPQRKILLSYPGESRIPAIVMGVNHAALSEQSSVVSAASCTSNALLPVVNEIHQAFGVERGVITTIHAAMHDQPVIDAYHSEDLRKNRAAYQSIIPVQTQLAEGVGRILPELDAKFVAHALRVPVTNVSALNVTLDLKVATSAEAINHCLAQAAKNQLKGILAYSTEPLASCDWVTDSHSAIVDAQQTHVAGETLANLLIWFDNEWAFANRMLDVALLMNARA
jgi:glyceraldehyde-3-phosphate dehydrogenase type I